MKRRSFVKQSVSAAVLTPLAFSGLINAAGATEGGTENTTETTEFTTTDSTTTPVNTYIDCEAFNTGNGYSQTCTSAVNPEWLSGQDYDFEARNNGWPLSKPSNECRDADGVKWCLVSCNVVSYYPGGNTTVHSGNAWRVCKNGDPNKPNEFGKHCQDNNPFHSPKP